MVKLSTLGLSGLSTPRSPSSAKTQRRRFVPSAPAKAQRATSVATTSAAAKTASTAAMSQTTPASRALTSFKANLGIFSGDLMKTITSLPPAKRQQVSEALAQIQTSLQLIESAYKPDTPLATGNAGAAAAGGDTAAGAEAGAETTMETPPADAASDDPIIETDETSALLLTQSADEEPPPAAYVDAEDGATEYAFDVTA